MSKKLSNIVKCLILPIAVYVIFFVFSKGRFGSLPGMLAIGRQFVLYCLVGWALMHNQLMGVWDFTPGAVVALAGIIGGNIALSTNTGVAGLVVFCILSAVTLCLLTFFVFQAPSYLLNLKMQAGPSLNASLDWTFFIITSTIILAAGSMFILWLGERITDKGIGNGISFIILIGIIARLPQSLFLLPFFLRSEERRVGKEC